jgi:hypothetical protein
MLHFKKKVNGQKVRVVGNEEKSSTIAKSAVRFEMPVLFFISSKIPHDHPGSAGMLLYIGFDFFADGLIA